MFQKKLRTEVTDYSPYGGLVDVSRILLVGPVGAGKSSSVNSMSSALKNKMAPIAYVQGAQRTATTNVGIQTKVVKLLLCAYSYYYYFIF